MAAQIPPNLQEYPTSKPRRSEVERRLLEWGCLGSILFICVSVILPVINGAREKGNPATCLSNERQQAIAMLMYAQDNDERFPPADQWMDNTFPFIKNESVQHCPELVKERPKAYGYAYNRNLSLLKTEKNARPEITPLLYDSNSLRRNASAPGLRGAASPPRHKGRNNLAYADGHVKAVDAKGNP